MIEVMLGFAKEKADFDQRLTAYQVSIGDKVETTEPKDLYNRFKNLGRRLEQLPPSGEIDFLKSASKTVDRTFEASFTPQETNDDNEQCDLWLGAQYFMFSEDLGGLGLSRLQARWAAATGLILSISAKQHDFAGFAIEVATIDLERRQATSQLVNEIELRPTEEPQASARELVMQGLACRLGLLEGSVAAAEESLLPVAA